MLEYVQLLSLRLGLPTETLLAVGVGLGVLLLLFGAYAGVKRPDPVLARIAAISGTRRRNREDRQFLIPSDKGPSTFMKAFVPGEKQERNTLQRTLAQAGLTGPNALQIYTLIRVCFGIGLPILFLILLFISRTPEPPLPAAIASRLAALSTMGTYQVLAVLIWIGYFGPSYWLNSRVKARKLRIEEGFPNALDLIQISIEAGMGFDAAMTRVGNELKRASPEIAQEFLTVQHQVQAGRPREAAMRDMADRVGLETVRSFANVIHQSMKFGTSMAQAMTTYSEELRQTRELRAQEMANKLPVKMSGVMASLMLPALVIMTIGPVVIRYINNF